MTIEAGTGNFYGRNIIADAGDVVAAHDASFGNGFELVPLGQQMSMHDAAAFGFLQAFSFFDSNSSDERSVQTLRTIFPIWQQKESERFSSGDDFQKIYAKAIIEINLLDLAAVAESQVRFFEWQDYLSKDTNVAPPDESTLRYWRNAQRITALAASQDFK